MDPNRELALLTHSINELSCLVEIPSDWETATATARLFATGPEEQRAFHRHPYRSAAALQYRQTYPDLPRPAQWFRVYTTNVSRSGVSFVHGEQLFPQERATFVLLNGLGCEIEVRSCRRIRRQYYQIGARIVSRMRMGDQALREMSSKIDPV
jgi:hypothetical protein